MGVSDIVNAVTVVIVIKVVLDAITVKVTWPFELVNTSVVIVVFVITSRSRAVGVFIGNAIVIVIHWVLVCKVECSNCLSSPWVNDAWVKASVSTNIPWVQTECFKGCNVYWPFENTVVVIVPILCIENTVVIVVEWIGSITSIETFEKVINSIVVIV